MSAEEITTATGAGATPEQFSHDAAYKALFGHPETVTSLLWDCVHEPFVRELDFSTLERMSGEYVTDDHHLAFSDNVWRVRWKNHPGWCYLVVLIEFQRKPDRLMAFRMWAYQVLFLLRLRDEGRLPKDEDGRAWLPLMFAVVVYNGEGRWNEPEELGDLFAWVPESLRSYLPQLKYFLIDVHRLALDKPERRDSLMAAVAGIERAMRFADIEAALKRLGRVVRLYGKRSLIEDFVTWIRKRFDAMHVPGDWKKELINFEEVGEVLNLGEMWRQEWRAEGLAEGLAEGRAEGLAEGELKTQRENLRNVLRHKFGESLPAHLAEETDVERLSQLNLAAACADSMSAFQALAAKELGAASEET